MKRTLGLKIDVDTYEGMKKGVPLLLDSLSELAIKGTFYLSMGPDASGLAVLQLLKNPRFLKKMLRSNAPGLYGFKTALYGTLLPSPMIALAFPELVRRIMAEGHEVQFHAWDHRRWQDSLPRRSEQWIRNWLDKGMTAFRNLTGQKASSFGAPAWLIDDRVMAIVGEYGFNYLSCTRAKEPFLHEGLMVPEIPSDLPCFEELGVKTAGDKILSLLGDDGLHVLPVHAEVEGGIWNQQFIDLIREIKKSSYAFKTLSEINNMLSRDHLSIRKYRLTLLPGRSVVCAV